MADWSREAMDRIMENVQERATGMRDYMRGMDIGTPLGQESVPDDVWLAAFDAQERKYPPQEWIDSDTGLRFTASAFTLALSFCEGGRELLNRARRLRGQ